MSVRSAEGDVLTPAHARPAPEVAASLGVDPATGLRADEVLRRRAAHGPNELPEAARTPTWRRLVAQLKDLLTLILLAAAAASFVVSGELKTPLVVLVVVVVNAVIGFVQENRAEASLDALRRMLVVEVRVRRDGELRTVPAAELVPGDVVAVEAGDRIPADGRLLDAVLLEVEEAALTGESLPVAKSSRPVDGHDLPVADRTSMVHMQTTVTRGRGELVVTATGAATEIGRVAGLLQATTQERTPLQRQLDQLAHSLAKLAGVIVVLVVAIGLLRGEAVSDLLLTAVALAVASIPEGLPAVTAVTLAIGVSKMARHHAIVKRLASVETLGCTTVVCSDKTGTLTLNQMTAGTLVVGGRQLVVTGEGYDPAGSVEVPDDLLDDVRVVADAMVLCSDATLRRDDEAGWGIVGDPTEGALVVLAAKAGVDAPSRRTAWPRVGEVPFDSAHKLMATVHEHDDGRLRLFAKGAPDGLLDRATSVLGPDGEVVPVEAIRGELEAQNAAMADAGLRVLALAYRDLHPHEWDDPEDHLDAVRDLVVIGLVGITDPPRPEAAAAIEEAGRAGIRVKMITGDHPSTAAAIGSQLGLAGGSAPVAVTGRDLDAMDDDELAGRIDEISVFARVSPEHKLRLVAALQARGEVVAMTGDGVNDAPALRRADMGIAMGITGTEVTKEAATMVLADDNFATIVEAVRRGRTIYDNIVKFVRFQLSTTLGFALVFLVAAALGIAGGQPFTAIAILWVNIIMDGPPAMALGLDPVDEAVMERPPRPPDEPILTRPRWVAIGSAAAVMAAGTLSVLVLAPGGAARAGEATVAGTMAFNTFVLFQFFNILNVRSDRASLFRRATLANRWLWGSLGTVVALQAAVTHLGPMQRLFDTTSISPAQWLVCAGVAASIVLVEELRKAWQRRTTARLPRRRLG
jgi:Ca2+-transporting ATPase